MAFTPAQLWECAEREVRRRKARLPYIGYESERLAYELEVEMMTEIAKILQDRAQGKLDL